MSSHPFPAISNPQVTTTVTYSGDVIINLRNLLTDQDLSPLFQSWRPTIKTQFLFRSGKIAMSDSDQSNEVHLVVDDITNVNGNINLHIPPLTTNDDTVIVASEPQIIENKVLDTCTIDSDLNIITNIVNADIKVGAGITDNKLALISDKAKLPSTIAYEDEANTFTSKQSFEHFDMNRQSSAPANPDANKSTLYVKQVDTNNDGIFYKIKKNGAFVEGQFI